MADMNDRMKEFERRSREAFDDSVEAMDAATRSRLARARAAALAELRERRLPWNSTWVPAGAAAAVALVAALLWTGDREQEQPAGPPLAALEELEMVASDEDFEMLDEDPAFYAWAAEVMDGEVG